MSRQWNCEGRKLGRQEEIECIRYFRQSPVWDRVFGGFREKYVSYGKFTGNVVLRSVSQEELETLEGFFGKSFHGQKSITISAEKFGKALGDSRFGAVEPVQLLELFFGERMVGRREEIEAGERRRREILEQATVRYAATAAADWLPLLSEMLWGGRTRNITEWARQLFLSADIMNALPYRLDRLLYLAVFATEVTGNPHAFDRGSEDGELLFRLIQMDCKARNIVIPEQKIFPTFTRQRYFLKTGILLDDLSNYALLFGMHAVKADGSIHPGMEGFAEEGDMLQVPMAVIARWKEVSCPDRTAYIVENPSVFAVLCGKMQGKAACMCMNGQPKMAALLVLDLLAAAGVKVFYAGDFDPEGLLIAQKISEYYQGEFEFWHMGAEDYESCRSNEGISDRRLKSLQNIRDERLLPVVRLLQECRVAGYQEKLLGVYQL